MLKRIFFIIAVFSLSLAGISATGEASGVDPSIKPIPRLAAFPET